MPESELQKEFKKITTETWNVSETYDEYRAGLLAGIKVQTDGEEAWLNKLTRRLTWRTQFATVKQD